MLSSLIGKALAQSQPAAVPPSDPGSTSAASPELSATPASSASSASPASAPLTDRSIFSRRSLGQLGLFFAGATFVALSTTVTRRAVARRKLEAQLKFFQQSGGTVSKGGGAAIDSSLGDGAIAASAAADPNPAPQGSLVALEALNLASLNVVSFFIMLAGGLSWALDLSSVDDLQHLSQRNLRGSLTGNYDVKAEEEAERELSEFMTRIMGPDYGKTVGGQPEEKPDDKTA
ncbi:hypothetical protein CMQ_5028 [Grosmannia clavigera kw1407]|uniref:Altered inheritance of mitochondria protein 11 n=1 Tax=Grosmannia clavigera (strain kw1407 / UAMH 11150) TaxID=655863 RepID=F0XJZ7_GROCL|nr:uncharacterized protein CMQ_5028 [Grosmannia clavigera kw1407]EFX01957.1 hypothetical protein CMQ_5028 [Grosmannia clavigera kw1407]